MSNLLRKANLCDAGQVQSITCEDAHWRFVEFELHRLEPGARIAHRWEDRETCIVVISGVATLSVDTIVEQTIGERMSPFERKKPWACYVPSGSEYRIVASTACELAICKAPQDSAAQPLPARIITPGDIQGESRGKGKNQRLVHNILPETEAASRLLVVEVFTDEGNTSSYPSHKHDNDDYPNETYLEEVYYHRIDPPQGFVFQRVYTDDRSLDESMAAYDQDVVLVPRGYHPVATIAGYDSYYLNVMAGPVRKWCFTWEEDHSWVNGPDYPRT